MIYPVDSAIHRLSNWGLDDTDAAIFQTKSIGGTPAASYHYAVDNSKNDIKNYH